ncbi:hypothetical protein Salat_2779200 [Sesamum alatum]|uniref:Uncharacterized protein n=1 Tax=Sesamum alatum TaxID=300844 RepID=A0AAE1XL15_9LAMI|nr:hypothetical protein Salat_2779200 [Sesamum alatum]
MAAAKQHSKKGRKTHRKSIFCSLCVCFGTSNRVSADHGDRKSAGSRRKTVENGQAVARSPEIISSSKQIHAVEAGDKSRRILASPAFHVIHNYKTENLIMEQSKNMDDQSSRLSKQQNGSAQETRSNLQPKLSHSVSLPLPRRENEKPAAGGGGGGGGKGKMGNELTIAREFESKLGALIITSTLIVMLVWGKLCAILCAAAWFYFIPRLRANMDGSYGVKLRDGKNRVDVDSWEYKKMVVLRGLLERH